MASTHFRHLREGLCSLGREPTGELGIGRVETIGAESGCPLSRPRCLAFLSSLFPP